MELSFRIICIILSCSFSGYFSRFEYINTPYFSSISFLELSACSLSSISDSSVDFLVDNIFSTDSLYLGSFTSSSLQLSNAFLQVFLVILPSLIQVTAIFLSNALHIKTLSSLFKLGPSAESESAPPV